MQQRFFTDKELPLDFNFDGWKSNLEDLTNRENATQWEIGDSLLVAEEFGGFTANEDWNSGNAKKFRSAAVNITGRSWGTLKNFKSMARKFPKEPADGSPSLRGDTISFGAYRLVAPLPPEVQLSVLEQAKREAKSGRPLTVQGMADLIKRNQNWYRSPNPQKKRNAFEKVTVWILPENLQAFRLAASVAAMPPQHAGSDVANFMFWATVQYMEGNSELMKKYKDAKKEQDAKRAQAEARNREYIARQSAENDRMLALMEDELDADVENKIPTY